MPFLEWQKVSKKMKVSDYLLEYDPEKIFKEKEKKRKKNHTKNIKKREKQRFLDLHKYDLILQVSYLELTERKPFQTVIQFEETLWLIQFLLKKQKRLRKESKMRNLVKFEAEEILQSELIILQIARRIVNKKSQNIWQFMNSSWAKPGIPFRDTG